MSPMVERILIAIKESLGYPCVDIELEDDYIVKVIHDSILTINSVSSAVVNTETMYTEDGSSVIKLDPEKVMKCLSVVSTGTFNKDGDLYSTPTSALPMLWSKGGPELLLATSVARKSRATLEQPLAFRMLDNYTILIDGHETSALVTYIPKWDVNNPPEAEYLDILTYARCRVQLIVGRARKKYGSQVDHEYLDNAETAMSELITRKSEALVVHAVALS